MKRYKRRTGARRPPRGRIYLRPYMGLEERITSVDAVRLSRRQEKMLGRDIRAFLGRHGDVSLILRPSVLDPDPVTVSVLHIAIDSSGGVRHYGLKGLRGWDLKNLDKVELPAEFDLLLGRLAKKA